MMQPYYQDDPGALGKLVFRLARFRQPGQTLWTLLWFSAIWDALGPVSSGKSYPTRPTTGFQPDTESQGRPNFLRKSSTSKSAKDLASADYQQNYANYQNCTIVRSHVPQTSYSTYVKLAPKILIFPIFVQVWSSGFLLETLCQRCVTIKSNVRSYLFGFGGKKVGQKTDTQNFRLLKQFTILQSNE